MRKILSICFFILLSSLSSVYGQNITEMANAPIVKETRAQDNIGVIGEVPLVKIEVIGMQPSLFKNTLLPKAPRTLTERAQEIRDQAYFQRRRFDDTGQAIEMENAHLYYKRDTFSYTKGIIFYHFLNNRMDIGLYRSNFSPATPLISGRFNPYGGGPDSSAALFRNGSRVFFSLRINIPTP